MRCPDLPGTRKNITGPNSTPSSQNDPFRGGLDHTSDQVLRCAPRRALRGSPHASTCFGGEGCCRRRRPEAGGAMSRGSGPQAPDRSARCLVCLSGGSTGADPSPADVASPTPPSREGRPVPHERTSTPKRRSMMLGLGWPRGPPEADHERHPGPPRPSATAKLPRAAAPRRPVGRSCGRGHQLVTYRRVTARTCEVASARLSGGSSPGSYPGPRARQQVAACPCRVAVFSDCAHPGTWGSAVTVDPLRGPPHIARHHPRPCSRHRIPQHP